MITGEDFLSDYMKYIEDNKISMVSDCTRKLIPNHVPCIRIRSFEDVR